MAYKLSEKHPKKRAFITGAGGGLGRGLSLALAKDGWTIGISDLKEEALAESKKLIEAAGGKAHTYQFDVSKREDYKKAFDDYVAKVGGLDLLINNAGVGDGGLFGDYALENWEWITNDLSGKNIEKLQDNILEIAEESYNEENVKIDIFSHNLYPIKTLVGTLGLSVDKVQNSNTNVVFDLGIINNSSVNISNITVNIKTKTKFERGEKNRKIYRTSNKEITNIKSGWKKNFEVIIDDADVKKIDWAIVSIKIGFIEFFVEKNKQ